MKALLLLFVVNAVVYSHAVPVGGGISGGFVKQGGFSLGGGSAEGYADGAGSIGGSGNAGFSASFGGGGGGGGGGGDIVKTVTVEKHVVPVSHIASGGASFSASFGGGGVAKHAHGILPEVVSEKVLEVEAPPQPPPQAAKKTVIERTLIPNYVEKRIQVPTYVEKTIRVPTYVEKTIRVPAAPTVVEKTISQEDVPAIEGRKQVKVEGAAVVPTVADYGNVHVYHKYKARPRKIYHKEIITNAGAGDFAGGAGYGGFGSGVGGGGFRAYASAGGNGGGLIDGIFNIPIQTLGAVKGFLGDFSGGVSAGGSFDNEYSTY